MWPAQHLSARVADSLSLYHLFRAGVTEAFTLVRLLSQHRAAQLRNCPIPPRPLSSPQTKANPSRTQVLAPSCAMPFPMQSGGIYSTPILPHPKGCLRFNLGENQISFDRHLMDWVGRWSQTKQQKHSPLLNPKVHANSSTIICHHLYSSILYSEVAQLCPTLCDPMDCSLPGSSVLGIL